MDLLPCRWDAWLGVNSELVGQPFPLAAPHLSCPPNPGPGLPHLSHQSRQLLGSVERTPLPACQDGWEPDLLGQETFLAEVLFCSNIRLV
uniref:Uncharacterized protein n=1 Tax=Sphaerodactylus townsendi TaxID=933632 RepID=A0ACB8ECW0_9SAUR